MLLLRAFLIWLIIIGLETVHGILRGLLLVPVLGDFFARQVSVFTGSLLIFSVAYVFIHWLRVESKQQLLIVGLIWVLLTVIFEIALGRFGPSALKVVKFSDWKRASAPWNLRQSHQGWRCSCGGFDHETVIFNGSLKLTYNTDQTENR